MTELPMKKHLLLPAMLLALSISSAAWSQSFTTGDGPGDGQQFEQRKAEILKRIGDHLAEIQQRQSCVQAANSPAALHACMPRHGEGHAQQ
jgi:hypothetical protein